MTASGRLIKMEVDFSDTVDKKLPEYQELAQVLLIYSHATCFVMFIMECIYSHLAR